MNLFNDCYMYSDWFLFKTNERVLEIENDSVERVGECEY